MELDQTASRHTLTYSEHALSPRDAMVFRTLLRLLKPKLKHCWEYSEQVCDLLVVGDNQQPQTTTFHAHHALAGASLLIGVTPRGREHYLCLPILPAEVLATLDAIGQILVSKGHPTSEPPVLRFDAEQAIVQRLQAGVSEFDWNGQRFKLKKWPAQKFVNSDARKKMATALLSIPMSLDWMMQRSKRSKSECIAFLAELMEADLLLVSSKSADGDEKLSPQNAQLPVESDRQAGLAKAGLLSRIRSRLGL